MIDNSLGTKEQRMDESRAEEERTATPQTSHDEREMRVWQLAQENADVRMLMWQRDAAWMQLNLITLAIGNGNRSPIPSHCGPLWYLLDMKLSPRMIEADYQVALAERLGESQSKDAVPTPMVSAPDQEAAAR